MLMTNLPSRIDAPPIAPSELTPELRQLVVLTDRLDKTVELLTIVANRLGEVVEQWDEIVKRTRGALPKGIMSSF